MYGGRRRKGAERSLGEYGSMGINIEEGAERSGRSGVGKADVSTLFPIIWSTLFPEPQVGQDGKLQY